jgi:hypothetical protein
MTPCYLFPSCVLVALEAAVPFRRLDEKISHAVVSGVVVSVGYVFSVTLPYFTRLNHLSASSITLRTPFLLLRLTIVLVLSALTGGSVRKTNQEDPIQ